MDNQFTVNSAYITAIAAIAAPVITTLINGLIQYHLARLSNALGPKLELFSSFSHAYSLCQYGSEKSGYMQKFYEETTKLIALCRHHRVRKTLFRLANEVHIHGASQKTDELYEKCLRLLAKEI